MRPEAEPTKVSSEPQSEPSQNRTIPVGQAREASLWCWASGSQLALNQLGVGIVPQSSIVQAVLGQVVNAGATSAQTTEFLNRYSASGISARETVAPNDRELYDELRAGHPALIKVMLAEGPHFYVAQAVNPDNTIRTFDTATGIYYNETYATLRNQGWSGSIFVSRK